MAEIVIVDGTETAGELAADAILALVARRTDAVLGLATGSTPLGVWRALETRRADLSRVRGFALDEYVGLPEGHPESYRAVILREVVEPLGLDESLVAVPGHLGPIETAGEDYERAIRAAGGVDLQVLGIGTDGHIGFNEPGSSFESLTRVKTLTQQTRTDNARFFASVAEVPINCITQGLGTIRRARHRNRGRGRGIRPRQHRLLPLRLGEQAPVGIAVVAVGYNFAPAAHTWVTRQS